MPLSLGFPIIWIRVRYFLREQQRLAGLGVRQILPTLIRLDTRLVSFDILIRLV